MLAIARVNNVPNKFDQTFDNTSNMKLEMLMSILILELSFTNLESLILESKIE